MTISKRELALLETIMVVAETNPKKEGSQAYERFEGYYRAREKHGKEFTIKDAYAEGVRGDDIRHDKAHGFILVGDDAIAEYEASQPTPVDTKAYEKFAEGL